LLALKVSLPAAVGVAEIDFAVLKLKSPAGRETETDGETARYRITTTPEPPGPPGGFAVSPATGEMSS
jgi:hypothetical protein